MTAKNDLSNAIDRYVGELVANRLEDTRILIIKKKNGEEIIRKVEWSDREDAEMMASVKRHYPGAKIHAYPLYKLSTPRLVE